uniref:Uncharacterized protein n=1 Tax=Arundo donax TaxID=35708 RepID=A0A0A8YWE4_ARUDO
MSMMLCFPLQHRYLYKSTSKLFLARFDSQGKMAYHPPKNEKVQQYQNNVH